MAGLTLVLFCGCSDGERAPLNLTTQDPSNTAGASNEPVAEPTDAGSLNTGGAPATGGGGGAGGTEESSGWDGSTTPTANHAVGIDAAAGEAIRGGPDASADDAG